MLVETGNSIKYDPQHQQSAPATTVNVSPSLTNVHRGSGGRGLISLLSFGLPPRTVRDGGKTRKSFQPLKSCKK